MIGDPNSNENKGVIPRTFDHIMKLIQCTKDKKFLVRCSFIEIYNEVFFYYIFLKEIRDLLAKDVK